MLVCFQFQFIIFFLEKLNFFFQVSSKQKRMSNGRKEEVSKKTECNRCSRVCLRPIVNYLCLLFLFNFYICLFVFRRTFDTMASMANENEGFNPTEGSAIFNPEKDATTGDATKDAATAFNRGLEQLAAKHGTEIYKPDENNSNTDNQSKGIKMISQETFDEVVKENVDDFEMSPEEALKDAIEQFESQGVNLGNITKKTEEDRAKLPVPTTLAEIKRAETMDDVCGALNKFYEICKAEEENKLLACSSAYEVYVFDVLEKFYVPDENVELSERPAEEIFQDNKRLMIAVLKAFMSCFWKGRAGPSILYPVGAQLIASIVKKPALSNDLTLLSTAIRCTRVTMTRNESVKGNFFQANGFDAYIKEWFNAGLEAGDTPFLLEVCAFVRVLLTDDDRRQGVHPYTFQRARILGERKRPGARAVLEHVLNVFRLVHGNADHAAEVCLTIRSLAVNDGICMDISRLGGTELLVTAMVKHIEHVRLCQHACVALKMISNNDANKALLSANGGIKVVLMALGTHTDHVGMQNQGLAALSSMTLRQPKNCLAIAEMHGINTVVNAMQRHPSGGNVQRSACLLLRNLVSRNQELVEPIVESGAGELIQLARETHRACDDVAFSALRDLGLGGQYKDARSAANN